LRPADEAGPLHPSAGSSVAYAPGLLLLPVLSCRDQRGPRCIDAVRKPACRHVAKWLTLLDYLAMNAFNDAG